MSQIVIFGDTSAGKTTFATFLPRALAKSAWHWHTDQSTLLLLREWQEDIHAGRFPAPNNPGKVTELNFFLARHRGLIDRFFYGRETTVALTIPDAAGIELDPGSKQQQSNFFSRYMADNVAAMVLVDASTTFESRHLHERYFQALLNRLTDVLSSRQRGKNNHPALPYRLAVCLTKCDAVSSFCEDGASTFESLANREILGCVIGQGAQDHLDNFTARNDVKMKIFATSCIGFVHKVDGGYELAGKSRVSQWDGTKLVKPTDIQPEGITAPLVWLLETFAGATAVRSGA